MATPGKFPAGVVELMVNGVVHRIDAAMARERKIDGKFTVVAFLREVLELKGTKLGCGVGGCGVCTVMLTRPVFTGRPQTAAQTETVMVNSCLLPLFALHQCAITTVEGVGTSAAPHPIQVAIAESHGTQCGFCTPGMVLPPTHPLSRLAIVPSACLRLFPSSLVLPSTRLPSSNSRSCLCLDRPLSGGLRREVGSSVPNQFRCKLQRSVSSLLSCVWRLASLFGASSPGHVAVHDTGGRTLAVSRRS
eukprot:m.125926 g.125926  ORF g.125926 m.125926 type:complete len:248 (+) comp22157_c0_seq4:81-824(+)